MSLIKLQCPTCGYWMDEEEEGLDTRLVTCPSCKENFQGQRGIILEPAPDLVTTPGLKKTAEVRRRHSLMGNGCLLQILGLLCFLLAILTILTIIWPVFFVVFGIVLILWGHNMSSWLECSACGGRVSRREISICPHCGSTIEAK